MLQPTPGSAFPRLPWLLVSAILAVLVFLITRNFPFFWDTIQLGSKQATHIFQTGSLLLPDRIDSGHPPGFGAYLAAWWSVLGRSLWVSHLAMAPWVMLVMYQLGRLCYLLLPGRWIWVPLFLLALVEPFLLGQLLLISPDVVLVGAFLLVFNSILAQQTWGRLLGTLLLAVISTRGMLVGVSLFLVDLILNGGFLPWIENRKILRAEQLRRAGRLLLPYLPGGLLGVSYLIVHLTAKGWIGHHPASPWAPSFGWAGPMGLVRNGGILLWRLFDFGRIFLWMALPIALISLRRSNREDWRKQLAPLIPVGSGFVVFGLLIGLTILPFIGLMNARYLLPVVLCFDLLVGLALLKLIPTPLLRRISFLTAFLFFATGNFWHYTATTAQAWDATPLHAISYAQDRAAITYLDSAGITLDSVATVFPFTGPLDDRYLNGRTDGFGDFQQVPTLPFLYYSSVTNDYPDEVLDGLFYRGDTVLSLRFIGMETSIYRRIKE